MRWAWASIAAAGSNGVAQAVALSGAGWSLELSLRAGDIEPLADDREQSAGVGILDQNSCLGPVGLAEGC
jgi:hypothetical protein